MNRPLRLPLAAAVAFASLASASAAEMTFGQYSRALRDLLATASSGDAPAAGAEAQRLLGYRIACSDGSVSPDTTVLKRLAEARDEASLREILPRLESLVAATQSDADVSEIRLSTDARLLKRIRAEQASDDPRRGGGVGPRAPEMTLPQWLSETISDLWEGLHGVLTDIWNWLRRFFDVGRSTSDALSGGRLRTLIVVIVIAVAAVLAYALYTALRRGAVEVPHETSSAALATSGRDADPLSRSPTEWERYAEQLHAAGRSREAIRAWFHAILVTLFKAGQLHYRKGRTNWEYAYSLSPEVAWRREYVELTREFERHWYGADTAPSESSRSYGLRSQTVLEAVHSSRGRAP